MFTAERYHDISCGHRVYGHESKCAHLHGHNYRITFICASEVCDKVGRVVDFSVIKDRLCDWVEDNWDHRFLIWSRDPHCEDLMEIDSTVVQVPFNPTAENMAQWLVTQLGPRVLVGTNVQLIQVRIGETAKCSASFTVEEYSEELR